MKRSALTILFALGLSTSAHANEVYLTGWFSPDYSSGYVNSDYDYESGDTSGTMFGAIINWSSNAILPWPKTLSVDTPVYGEVTDTFTTLDYLYYTPAGEFYQYSNASGWLDVDIVFPGHGRSSFSFLDNAVSPPPPIDPPPCIIDCGGVTPPPVVIGAPEPSTWLMMFIGFACLGFAAFRQRLTNVSVL